MILELIIYFFCTKHLFWIDVSSVSGIMMSQPLSHVSLIGFLQHYCIQFFSGIFPIADPIDVKKKNYIKLKYKSTWPSKVDQRYGYQSSSNSFPFKYIIKRIKHSKISIICCITLDQYQPSGLGLYIFRDFIKIRWVLIGYYHWHS